ncbi:contact-dependent growth inhibition system immunity protein [Actinoplanes solisilvae]|uniref:contact-dependent growth inhibition system immunity protein n=1 Tax=Actinoplanes solisilvae TaxID=2486853 RepID=UPI000FD72F92|nr:contact-dependent growth inhibition system immunity protein [Actinoplanes solisilvae]
MYTNLAYLAQSYFHQDFQDEADEPIEVVERFRDSESAEVVEALRAEIATLLESDATEEDLSRIWLTEAGAYYDPEFDEISTREWLVSVAEALTAPSGPDAGIPFKGSPGI